MLWTLGCRSAVAQSTLGATWNISKQRLLGTFLGAAAGAAVGTYLELAVAVYGLALFTVGLICRILRLDQSAYRFAGIALTLVMLTSGTEPPWVEGIHRFAEVSLGIVVGLVFSAVWPKTEPPSGQP